LHEPNHQTRLMMERELVPRLQRRRQLSLFPLLHRGENEQSSAHCTEKTRAEHQITLKFQISWALLVNDNWSRGRRQWCLLDGFLLFVWIGWRELGDVFKARRGTNLMNQKPTNSPWRSPVIQKKSLREIREGGERSVVDTWSL
jgi:hypothetical protein